MKHIKSINEFLSYDDANKYQSELSDRIKSLAEEFDGESVTYYKDYSGMRDETREYDGKLKVVVTTNAVQLGDNVDNNKNVKNEDIPKSEFNIYSSIYVMDGHHEIFSVDLHKPKNKGQYCWKSESDIFLNMEDAQKIEKLILKLYSYSTDLNERDSIDIIDDMYKKFTKKK